MTVLKLKLWLRPDLMQSKSLWSLLTWEPDNFFVWFLSWWCLVLWTVIGLYSGSVRLQILVQEDLLVYFSFLVLNFTVNQLWELVLYCSWSGHLLSSHDRQIFRMVLISAYNVWKELIILIYFLCRFEFTST